MKEKEFSKFLINNSPNTDFVSKLKIKYRPYICPFDTILDMVGNQKKVFDIGCGSGMFLSLYAEYKRPVKIGGVEVDEKLIANSKILLQKYKVSKYLEVYDGKEIPNEISDYNFITLIDVLHHISPTDQKNFLERIIKKMSKGSILIIKDIDRDSPLVIFNKIHDLIFSKEVSNELSYKELKSDISKKGLEIVKSFKKTKIVYPHYFLLIKKI